jgi:hypothetical protein
MTENALEQLRRLRAELEEAAGEIPLAEMKVSAGLLLADIAQALDLDDIQKAVFLGPALAG